MGYEFLKHFIKEPIYLVSESDQQEDEELMHENETKASNEPEPAQIIDENKPAKRDISHNEQGMTSIGKVETKVMVIVRYPYVETLPENEKNLLIKILKSAGLAYEEITLLNIVFGDIPKKEILSGYSHILIFDTEASLVADLNLKNEKYTRQEIGTISYIVADPLESIHEDMQKKTRLWNVLKKIFNLEH